MSNDTFKDLGQLFMVATEGPELSAHEREVLQTMQPAGLTLFTRNLHNLEQICVLNRALLDCFGTYAPILAIDQEGGLKERLPMPPFTHWPGNPTLAKLHAKNKSSPYCREQYRGIARELKVLGFNVDFAPVADIIDPEQLTFMHERAFGADPQAVAELTVAALAGLADEGIIGCAKHFPGHGPTSTDSHLDLPRIERTREQLSRHDLVPFRAAVQADCPMFMTAHILYPDLDPTYPATLSPRIINDGLRKQLGFKGLIVTDDLNMHAVSKRYGNFDVARLSLLAGCNILLYCDGVDAAFAIYKEMRQRLESPDVEPALYNAATTAIDEVRAWKQRWLANPPQPDPAAAKKLVGDGSGRRLAAQITQAL